MHGMSADEVAPDWPALDDDEVARTLVSLDRADVTDVRTPAHVTWVSPRPMSSAALVTWGDAVLFVKRHDLRVRSLERLRVEHAFAQHLRERGQSVPRILRFANGDTVLRRGGAVYEVHESAAGVDLYRDVPSWYPFTSLEHARAAGATLAQLHDAARDFTAPATTHGVLSSSVAVVAASDPIDALRRLVTARPALSRALASRPFDADVAIHLAPALTSGAAFLAPLAPLWGHGDWHPSNLMWTSADEHAEVASILDLGLANRTTRVHDLAVALERSVVDWLDVTARGDVCADLAAADALLDGYESVYVLSDVERTALVHALPVAHVEFALSEVEYFYDVVHSSANTDLAYDGYLLGHVRWFAEENGIALLEHVRGRWR